MLSNLEKNQFEGSFPSPFIKVQKVPLAPLVQCHGQFTGQKGGEEGGEMAIEEAQVQSMEGDQRTNVP